MAEYVTIEAIVPRLAVLYAKADRAIRYDASCKAGRPDFDLLDSKQQEILLRRRLPGDLFPGDVLRTVRWSIDVLERRRRALERRKMRFMAYHNYVETGDARALCECGEYVRTVRRGELSRRQAQSFFPSECWSCRRPTLWIWASAA